MSAAPTTRSDRERVHFDRLAEQTGDVWWGHRTPFGRERLALRIRLLGALLERLDRPRCVELGCGIGTFSEPLLEAHPALQLTGIDISPRCVDLARSRLARFESAQFLVGDACELPFPAHSVDVVLGNSVLHHLDLERTLTDVHRVLRPGGWLWFSEPNMLNPQIALEKNLPLFGRWLENSPDETAFVRQLLGRRLRRAGFDQVSIRPYDFLHPGLPGSLLGPARLVNALLERTPLVREIAGSLEISARRT